jgi:hypothetical protein
VVLVRGAQACNVVWQVGSSATLGTGTSFKGHILALQSITLNNRVTVDGSTLARNAAVTLDENTISSAPCKAATGETAGPNGETGGTGSTGGTSGTGGTDSSGGTGGPGSSGGTGGTGSSGGTGGTGSSTGTGGTGSGSGTGGAGSGSGTSGTPAPGGGRTTGDSSTSEDRTSTAIDLDSNGRPVVALASSGAGRTERRALSGLALTGLGLMILRVTKRRTGDEAGALTK